MTDVTPKDIEVTTHLAAKAATDGRRESILALAHERADLVARKAAIEASIKSIDEEIEARAGNEEFRDGAIRVFVQANERVNYKALAADYPEAEHPDLYSSSIDTAKVKQEFAPADLDAYKESIKSTVKVVAL